MATKIHPKWKTILDRKGELVRVKVPLKDCPFCNQRCLHCGWPFTLSTALDYPAEMVFCSESCRNAGIEYDWAHRSERGGGVDDR